MTEKMTHSTALSMAIALLTSDTATDHSEIVEHLTALRASLDKRAERAKSTERKPSPKQIAQREESDGRDHSQDGAPACRSGRTGQGQAD